MHSKRLRADDATTGENVCHIALYVQTIALLLSTV